MLRKVPQSSNILEGSPIKGVGGLTNRGAASFVVPEGFRMTAAPPEELTLTVQKQNPKVEELLGRRLCIGGRVLGGVWEK